MISLVANQKEECCVELTVCFVTFPDLLNGKGKTSKKYFVTHNHNLFQQESSAEIIQDSLLRKYERAKSQMKSISVMLPNSSFMDAKFGNSKRAQT